MGGGGNKEDIIKLIIEAKFMFNNKKQLLCSNNLSLEIKIYKKLYLECCCLWIRNVDCGKNGERMVNAFGTS